MTVPMLAERFQYGDLYYEVTRTSEPRTVSVTYEKKSSSSNYSNLTHVSIPSHVVHEEKTYTVTSISRYAFQRCSSLVSIIIPNTITSIAGDDYNGGAFKLCSSLENVTIGSGVNSIGDAVFSRCSSLKSIIVDENNVTYDSRNNCNALIETATNTLIKGSNTTIIPNTITTIGERAFHDLSSLTTIVIPDNVVTIGNSAFSGSSLKEVYIGVGLTDLESGAFSCDSLKTVFWNAKSCSDIKNSQYRRWSNNSITSFSFGDSVKHIPNYLCESLYHLQVVTIGKNVESIGYRAFYNCDSLKTITIPKNVKSIGNSAFYDCDNLLSLDVENAHASIGESAFKSCNNLLVADLGNCITTLEAEAFCFCESLSSIIIPTSITRIGDNAFDNCLALASVELPSSLISIGKYAFQNCSTLVSITIPKSVKSIDKYAFVGCRYISRTNYTGDIADWCKITFGDSKANPIYYSRNIYINEQKVRNLIIPNTVDSIQNYAFYNCYSLDSVSIEATTPPVLNGSSTFSSSPTCYIPCGTLAAYQSSSWAEQVGSFVEQCDEPVVDANKCGDNLYWAYTDGTLTITGTGTMYNYDDMDNLAPWNSIRNNIKNIVLPEGLTSIGEWAFYLCASVTSISIPEGVSSIGVRAFCNCSSLTSISIPNSVTSVGERAFYSCYNLASATLSTNLSKIDKYLFGQCRTLTAITIPNNVTAIENGAFSGCSSLDSISIEATNPPVLSGSSTFSSSPTCYIPCGTLAVYQSSSWAEQVGGFVEQCDDNDNNQSLISVTDATLSDWDNLPMEYLFESKCVEGASLDALKSVKVYADLTYINLVVEWDTEIVTDLTSVPFHVYLNVDNDAPTGGFGDQWVKPNIDLLLEGYFYLDGNPCAYQPDVALYAGTPLANEWAWDWTTIEALAASQLITKGVMEIQIEYGKLPVKLENTFTVGFDIQQSWNSVGVLPNAAADEAGNMILAEKMLVRINNVNAPTSIENTHSPSSITNTQKLLRNGQLIILHDGKTYTVMGAEIK